MTLAVQSKIDRTHCIGASSRVSPPPRLQREPELPSALTINVPETLALLDGDYAEVARGVARQDYALWLGSGISLDRIVGVKGVIERVLEYLRMKAVIGDSTCQFNLALDEALITLTTTEKAGVNLAKPVHDWVTRDDVLNKLASLYSHVLDIRLPGEVEDFLLWVGVDVPSTFTVEDPDVEHVCVALLALESAVSDVASANWDYLIERAEARLTDGAGGVFDICILGQDFKASSKQARLMKFHGCAALAVQNPEIYRQLLIARESQIAQWRTNKNYAAMKQNLLQLALDRRTLMIGFSALDRNIQDLFVDAEVAAPWGWPNPPTPHVFAEETLSTGQKLILKCVYKDQYQDHQADIDKTARLPAYGKSLLLALFLHVLESKLAELAILAKPAVWPEGDLLSIRAGLRHLRNRLASVTDPDRLQFLATFVAAFSRAQRLYHEGRSEIAPTRYHALTTGPLQQVASIPISTGLREAALALSVLGLGEKTGEWTLFAGGSSDHKHAPIIVAAGGRQTRFFFAANDDASMKLFLNGVVDESDHDAVIALSSSPGLRRRRSPVDAPGRDGHAELREISISALLHETSNATDFSIRFKQEASL